MGSTGIGLMPQTSNYVTVQFVQFDDHGIMITIEAATSHPTVQEAVNGHLSRATGLDLRRDWPPVTF